MALSDPLEVFTWGAGGSKMTPEEIARQRKVAEALTANGIDTSPVGHWTQGLARVANALSGAIQRGRADKAEAANAEGSQSRIAAILGGMNGGGAAAFPPAPGAQGQTFTTGAGGATVSGGPAPDMSGNQIYSEFMDGIKGAGVSNPNALAAIAATGKAESGFSPGNVFRTWSDPSQSGQAGTAGGIMSWRGPRLQAMQQFAAANGGDPRRPSPALQAQFLAQEDPNLIAALNNAKSPAEAQQLMNNAWKFAGYNRQDGETARRLALANSFAPSFASAQPAVAANAAMAAGDLVQRPGMVGPSSDLVQRPGQTDNLAAMPLVQTASLDPSVGMPQAGVTPGSPGAESPAGQRVLSTMMSPQSMTGGAALPMQGTPQAAPQQVAQAAQTAPQEDLSRIPIMAGGTAGIAPAGGSGFNPGMQAAIAQALSSPYASEGERRVAGILLQQQMENADPGRQLDLEYRRAQIDALQRKQESPQPLVNAGGGAIYNPNTGEWLAAPNAEGTKAPTVQKLKMDDGSEMAVQWNSQTGAWDPINAPQGGGGIAPKTKLTENQSKLTLFQSLQTESQPVLLDLEKQFNPANIADAAARSTPIAGNFFQSEQGQMYNAAATAWAEGALRIATGAAATPEEMERTKKAYFAQVGDTPITIAFKAQMREMYNRSIERALGNDVEGGLPKPSEFVKQFTNIPKQPTVIDGYTVEEVE